MIALLIGMIIGSVAGIGAVWFLVYAARLHRHGEESIRRLRYRNDYRICGRDINWKKEGF